MYFRTQIQLYIIAWHLRNIRFILSKHGQSVSSCYSLLLDVFGYVVPNYDTQTANQTEISNQAEDTDEPGNTDELFYRNGNRPVHPLIPVCSVPLPDLFTQLVHIDYYIPVNNRPAPRQIHSFVLYVPYLVHSHILSPDESIISYIIRLLYHIL